MEISRRLVTLNSCSMSLSKVGTGESNHLHWTRTGLPLSLSVSILVLEARKEQLRPPSRVGLELPSGVTSEMLGVLGRRKGREMNGFLILRCEGELRPALVGVTGEAGARVRSVMEGEEDRELELDREIVSVQRANLDISTLNVKNIYIWRSIFFIKRH